MNPISKPVLSESLEIQAYMASASLSWKTPTPLAVLWVIIALKASGKAPGEKPEQGQWLPFLPFISSKAMGWSKAQKMSGQDRDQTGLLQAVPPTLSFQK